MTADRKTALDGADDDKGLPRRPADPNAQPTTGGDGEDAPVEQDEHDAEPDLDDVEPSSDADKPEK